MSKADHDQLPEEKMAAPQPGRTARSAPPEAVVKGDAAAQFAPSQGDAENNGLDSAVPRVTGEGTGESIAKAWDENYHEPDQSLPDRPR